MDSILIPIAHTRSARFPAPLRRSMPGKAGSSPMSTPLLAVAGLVVLVDIEFALAYLLYVAARVVG